LIGQAKGVIMATLRSTAFALWSTSRSTNRKVVDVAADITSHAQLRDDERAD